MAERLLAQCLAGEPPKKLPPSLLQEPCAAALFRIFVEGLADRFEPALCDAYAKLFSQALALVDPSLDAASLAARYQRVRRPRAISGKPQRIYVLSRVTLGADVAVTSVLLHAVRRRFPHAETVFVGPRKNYELFAGDAHIHHAPLEYRRGSLQERFAAGEEVRRIVDTPHSIVIDPDSRLTQLGLLPVCPEETYYFFESRAYGGDGESSLPELASKWARETIGIGGARPFVALGRGRRRAPCIAISLGVGENPAKRLPDPFEADLLRVLAASGLRLCIDKGAGGAEAEQVDRALEQSGVEATVWDGAFAGFASIIAASRLYVGYDSAGQHVAAACGVPLISIFAGFPVPRMFARWRPAGEHCHVIRVEQPVPGQVLAKVRELLDSTLGDSVATA
ncbi:MAG: hypothetical protein C5B51_10340 [Terriglobia bacterium]|nr:MAG: hypothetical protein C5B51_10340 [Terriglobia bacterium]